MVFMMQTTVGKIKLKMAVFICEGNLRLDDKGPAIRDTEDTMLDIRQYVTDNSLHEREESHFQKKKFRVFRKQKLFTSVGFESLESTVLTTRYINASHEIYSPHKSSFRLILQKKANGRNSISYQSLLEIFLVDKATNSYTSLKKGINDLNSIFLKP